jgi:putative FmdB family regulatory protein
MPIFEYKCSDCDKVFEIVYLPGKDSELKCAVCGSTNLKKLISAPFLPSSVGKPANEELKSCCGAADPQECPGPGSCCSQ